MPGTFILKPIEANLTHNTDLIGKMDPYCAMSVGNVKVKGQICKKGGKHPHWTDTLTVPINNESKVLVELMDKDKITHDDNIGSVVLDLREVQSSGKINRWYPLTYKNKPAGEILLETMYQPQEGVNMGMAQGQQYAGTQDQYISENQHGAIRGQNQYYEQEKLHTAQQGVTLQEEVVTTTTTTVQPTTVIQQEVHATDNARHSNVWTEQHQVIEPHKFMKEVEVVETRSAFKEIEVMEQVKVLKDVQYTHAVPVHRQIEVSEPHVVIREVEVMEPRLVTKTIQVIENVPVTRQVEVIEMRNTIQELDTFEPQSFHKQVEVIEYVPVKKQVEVTEPVTMRKSVEFVEPVITTQTITKELHEPIIINEKTTTSVGPASVIGISSEYGYVQQFGEISISERQRLGGLQRWIGYQTIFSGLSEQERLWEQLRLSRLNQQELLQERERLMGMSEKDRILYQKNFFKQYSSSAGRQTLTQSSKYNPIPNF